MNNLIQVTPEELKEGDRVSVTFEGRWSPSYFVPDGSQRCLSREIISEAKATIHRLPPKARPLEKGEVVLLNNAIARYEVFAAHGNLVWLQLVGNDGPNSCLHEVTKLSRPCGTPIQIEGE